MLRLDPEKVKYIVIHCTATPAGRHHTVDEIRKWHQYGNGWRDIGYHYVIEIETSPYQLAEYLIKEGRSLQYQGAHVAKYNHCSVGVCYVGGMSADMRKPQDTRTLLQRQALALIVAELKQRFPGAKVVGHRDLDPRKACPSFDVSNSFS